MEKVKVYTLWRAIHNGILKKTCIPHTHTHIFDDNIMIITH
jgi:hypothetical protein